MASSPRPRRPRDRDASQPLIDGLPPDVLARVLECITLPALPAAVRAIALTCARWRAALEPVWPALARRLEPAAGAGPRAAAGGARRSDRLVRSARDGFVHAYASLRARTENLHHAIATAAQDARDLSVARVRRLLERWGPCLLDRVSPVYDATALMEVCRARGVSDATLASIAAELLRRGASARAANADGLSPLLIASARGLPRLAAVLLGAGADPDARGRGGFRLCGSQRTLRGHWSAREWVVHMLERERAAGVPSAAQRSLRRCGALLEGVAPAPPEPA